MSDARQLIGGDARALDIGLLRACEAVKDRTADHLGSIIGREQILDSERALLAAASKSELSAMIAAPTVRLVQRVRAALILSGRYPDQTFVKSFAKAASCALGILRDIGVPEILIAACEAYAAKSRDLMPVAVPLAWCEWKASGESMQQTTYSVPEPELIGDIQRRDSNALRPIPASAIEELVCADSDRQSTSRSHP
jgi:hypothetical protein